MNFITRISFIGDGLDNILFQDGKSLTLPSSITPYFVRIIDMAVAFGKAEQSEANVVENETCYRDGDIVGYARGKEEGILEGKRAVYSKIQDNLKSLIEVLEEKT